MTTVAKKRSTKKTLYYEAVGRRKESVCRVRLYLPEGKEMALKGNTLKKGTITVNDRAIADYFTAHIALPIYIKPLTLTNCVDRFITVAHMIGGGKAGQLDAFTLALSRALVKVDAGYRDLLKKEGLLKVDARVRERRKVGTGGKARRAKQSPKR